MPSIPAVMMRGIIKIRVDRFNNSIKDCASVAERVDAYRRDLEIDAGALIMGDCRAEDVTLAGRPATWITRDDFPADRVVLYLHGGGYLSGDLLHNRNLASDIARTTGQKVLMFDYRMAPEFPFPAALDDTLAAWQALIDDGYQPQFISILGCSAGGGLALAAALALRDAAKPLPGTVIGLSPWLDLTMSQITIRANKDKDAILNLEFLQFAAGLYAAEHNPANPLISPLFADLTGLPPLMLQVASEEMLLGEVVALADKAEKSGVVVDLEIFEGMWHVWQALNELVPESRAALEKVGIFIRKHTLMGEPEKAAEQPLPVVKKSNKVKKGLIHIHCGDGQGKTTAALGLTMRAIGHGRRVMLVQFLKNGRSGELAAMRSIPGIHVLSGAKNTPFSNVMTDEDKAEVSKQHLLHLNLAIRAAKAGEIDMLVLDEALEAARIGMLPADELLAFLREKPPALEVLLTGRNATEEFLAIADYISEVHCVRHPYDKGIMAREGIEY